jgi:cystathionine beta-lyase
VYYPFTNVVERNNRKLINNPLVFKDGKYVMDYEDMEKKIVEHQVKLFLLCSPHNPVSRVWSKEELEQAAKICEKHDVILVVDEIHCDFILKGNKHTPFGTLGETYAQRAVICTAPSKTFNLAGLQLSNIVIQNPKLRKQFIEELNRTAYYGANLYGQMACQAAYEKGEAWLTELLDYLQGNVELVEEYLAKNLPKVHLIKPEGTYLLWMDFRDYGYDAKTLQDKMLHEAKLWLDEGVMFGPEGAGLMRINIASPRSVVQDALERMQRVFG